MRKAADGRWGAVVVALAFVAASIPILLVAMPPVMDYPNHLARIWLLSGAADTPPLSSFYAVVWSQAATNIAVDFVAAQIARVLPIFVTSKFLLLALFLGPPTGAVLLNRALFGGFHLGQIALLALAWTTSAVAGFLSFHVSLATALLFAALVARHAPASAARAFPLHLLACSLLLPIHPWGVLFYLAMVAGLSIGERLDVGRPREAWIALVRRIVLLGVAGALPVLALLFLAPHPPGANLAQHVAVWGNVKPQLGFWGLLAKAIDYFGTTLLSPILTYDLPSDVLFAAPIVALFGWAAWTGRLRIHAGLAVVAVVLIALALVMPRSIGDAGWTSRRLPLMAALTILAAARPVVEAPRMRALAATLLIATTLARIAWIGGIWTARQSDVQALFAASRTVEPGAAVLILQQTPVDRHAAPLGRYVVGGPAPNPAERHFGSLLVISNRVFIPTLFTTVGQQPLQVRSRWRDRSAPSSAVPPVAELGGDSRKDPYLRRWRQDFDYLLVIDADLPGTARLPHEGLRALPGQGAPGQAAMRMFRIVPER